MTSATYVGLVNRSIHLHPPEMSLGPLGFLINNASQSHHAYQYMGNYFTQPERVFEKDINKSRAQRSRVTTQTRIKENYHIYI
jgi:hypothetical protein